MGGVTAAQEYSINAMEFDICNSSSNRNTQVVGGYNTVEGTTRGAVPSRLAKDIIVLILFIQNKILSFFKVRRIQDSVFENLSKCYQV